MPPEWAFTFHGHRCPFMPLGYRMGLLALEALGVDREADHTLHVICELGEGHPQTWLMDGIQIATGATGTSRQEVHEIHGVRLITARTEAASTDSLREAADHLRDQLENGVVVLGSVIEGKPSLVAMATREAVGQGAHAGRLLREVAPVVGGGGGGRPDMAQAGGRDADRLDTALATVPEVLARQLNGG